MRRSGTVITTEKLLMENHNKPHLLKYFSDCVFLLHNSTSLIKIFFLLLYLFSLGALLIDMLTYDRLCLNMIDSLFY